MAAAAPPALDADEEAWILERASVPEHVPSLMAALAGGSAVLHEGTLLVVGPRGVLVVGHPLEGAWDPRRAEAVLEAVRATWRPDVLRWVGPAAPPSLEDDVFETDAYHVLALDGDPVPRRLAGVIARAEARFAVAARAALSDEHRRFLDAFAARARLRGDVADLYARVARIDLARAGAEALEARAADGRLAALFVLVRAARRFDAWLLGARAFAPFARHASDLLMAEAARRARAAGKERFELGLGVREGVRRFKRKWGGGATRPYVACESGRRRSPLRRLLESLGGGTT